MSKPQPISTAYTQKCKRLKSLSSEVSKRYNIKQEYAKKYIVRMAKNGQFNVYTAAKVLVKVSDNKYNIPLPDICNYAIILAEKGLKPDKIVSVILSSSVKEVMIPTKQRWSK